MRRVEQSVLSSTQLLFFLQSFQARENSDANQPASTQLPVVKTPESTFNSPQ